ncbi:hypothetical protein LCGC14_0175800 [marine sediment metagenome]|uniref:Uncharacterized protein n=1 Tax=marine sediment metagenome TaxID=412755 RepID=A0A0F9X9P5_9ZZZZ
MDENKKSPKPKCEATIVIDNHTIKCREDTHTDDTWHKGLFYARQPINDKINIFITQQYHWRKEKSTSDEYIQKSNDRFNKPMTKELSSTICNCGDILNTCLFKDPCCHCADRELCHGCLVLMKQRNRNKT